LLAFLYVGFLGPFLFLLSLVFRKPGSFGLHTPQLRNDLRDEKSYSIFRDELVSLPIPLEAGERRRLHHCLSHTKLLWFKGK
jgi:hypothetical protein